MGIYIPSTEEEGCAQRLIKRKVAQLLRTPYFTEDDRDDVEQELYLYALLAVRKFDSCRGRFENFLSKVLKNAGSKLAEAQRAGKRVAWHQSVSWETVIENENGELGRRHQRIDQEEYFRRTGQDSRENPDLLDLSVDLGLAEESLPARLRTRCAQLRGSLVAELARDLGISRSPIYEDIREIRRRFQAMGLTDYLERPPTDSSVLR